ncbi:MAG: GerMN domain-containing protein [Alkaliphilus sp.]
MKLKKLTCWILLFVLIVIIFTACQNPFSRFFDDEERTEITVVVGNNETIGENLRETLVYYKKASGMIVPLMKNIPWEEGIAKRALMQLVDQEALREELNQLGLIPVLPEGTEIIGMSINEGICKVNFSAKVLSYDSEAAEKAMITAVVYTLTEFETIDRVQILVEGNRLTNLRYGTVIAQYIERENINLISELENNEISIVLYYKAKTDTGKKLYVPVTKGINALKPDIRSALVALVESVPEDKGLVSDVPAGVTVNDVFVKDGIAFVDLSEEISLISNDLERQQAILFSMGLTLKEIEPTINQVRILSSGKAVSLEDEVEHTIPTFANTR